MAERTQSRLTDTERATVERHIPLIKHTLKRSRYLVGRDRVARSVDELFQVAAVALIRAVKNYPGREGDTPFAAFAMHRMHNAISVHAHERKDAVRVPYITHRRWRKGGVSPVRCLSIDPIAKMLEATTQIEDGGNTDQINQAMQVAIAKVKRGKRLKDPEQSAAMADAMLAERWTITTESERTSIRAIANRFGVSCGRVTHLEGRFKKHLAAELGIDTKSRRWHRKVVTR